MTLTRLVVMRGAAAGAIGLSVALLAYAAFAAPRGDGRRLGLRGLKRERALEVSEIWRSCEPTVRWVGTRFSGLLPDSVRASLNRQIGAAGDFLGLLPEELVGLCVLGGLAGLCAGYWLGAWAGVDVLGGVGGLALGAVAPILQLWDSGIRRFKDISRRLPSAIDLLALAMGAGLDFPSSIRQVVEKAADPNDPLIEELTLVLQSLQLGRTRQQALEEFAARVPTEPVREFVAAVVQAEIRGNPLANVLRVQAEVSRQRRALRAEEAAARAGVAMVVPLMLAFLAILVLIVAPLVMTFHALKL